MNINSKHPESTASDKLMGINEVLAEIDYIAGKYGIPKLDVLLAMWAAGKEKYYSRSRKMIYSKLREMGYVINTK